jgi:hypothetical protein
MKPFVLVWFLLTLLVAWVTVQNIPTPRKKRKQKEKLIPTEFSKVLLVIGVHTAIYATMIGIIWYKQRNTMLAVDYARYLLRQHALSLAMFVCIWYLFLPSSTVATVTSTTLLQKSELLWTSVYIALVFSLTIWNT